MSWSLIDRHGIYEKSASNTMIVFVHDFGNLRIEAEYHDTCEPNLVNSYLVCFIIAQGSECVMLMT